MANLSPAMKHRQRVLAARTAAASADTESAAATVYEQVRMALAKAKMRLKAVQSIERKIELKAQLLPEFDSWVDGVLAGNTGAVDDVLTTVMVWRIDVGDLTGALPLAQYVLRHGLAMPDQYQRTAACLIAEEYADTAEKLMAKGEAVDANLLASVLDMVAEHDMPDEVRGKLHRAFGAALDAASVFAEALAAYERASALNPKAGVKKRIEQLQRLIKNAAAEPPAQPAAPPGASG